VRSTPPLLRHRSPEAIAALSFKCCCSPVPADPAVGAGAEEDVASLELQVLPHRGRPNPLVRSPCQCPTTPIDDRTELEGSWAAR
jgi:hypothetical protein